MSGRSWGKTLLLLLGCAVWVASVAAVSSISDGPALFRTLCLGMATALIAVPLGGVIHWLMRHAGWLGRLATIATVVLLFFPMFLHVSLWDAAFGRLGWLTSTQGQVLKPIVSGWTAAAWIHGIAAAPQVAIIFWLDSQQGKQAYEEQASLDAGPVAVMLHLKWKRILSVSLLAMAWVIVTCSREIAVTDIYRIGTLAEQVYLGYSMGSLGSVAGAWSMTQLNVAREFQLGPSLIPIGCLCLLFAIGFVQLTSVENHNHDPRPIQRRNRSCVSVALAGVVLFLTIVIPFSNVLYRSGYSVRRLDGEAVGGFAFSQVRHSLQRALTEFGEEFFWSAMIAAVASTVILVLSAAMTWLAMNRRFFRWGFMVLLGVSLAVPGPLIGSTIAEAFSNIQSPSLIWLYDRTIFAPVVASTIFCWPLAGMLVWFLLSQTDRHALQSMQLDGGTAWDLFWQLGVLGNAWSLAGAWLVTFALSFGELSASQLVVPPGIDTVPRLMLGLLHAGVDEMTAAITILIAATIFTVSLLAYGMLAKRFATTN